MPIAAEIYYRLYDGSQGRRSLPIVLIHGAGGHHLFWPSELRRLPGFRVFALDLPGHGKSGDIGRQSISAYVDATLGWMESLGLQRVFLVGHSMGGAIALTLALDHPEYVWGLGLVGTGARLRVAPVLLENVASPATYLSAVQLILSWSFSPHTPQKLIDLAGRRMAETRQTVLNGDFLACDSFDVMERLPSLHQKTLVICGEDDKVTPLRYSQYLADHIPGAVLKIIPHAGHMVMLEQPEMVEAALLEFLHSFSY